MRPLIHVLSIQCHGQQRHPVALETNEGVVLVDCPDPGYYPQLRDALVQSSLDPAQICAVILTHHDYDHLGTLAEILVAAPAAKIYASAAETPYISGQFPSLRLPKSDNTQANCEFRQMLLSIPSFSVNNTLEDGQELPWCGGAIVILTPGHTPGHLSLYLPWAKTLIAGDALCAENGCLFPPSSQYTLNMPQALRSLHKLQRYPICCADCYHGGIVVGDNLSAQIAFLAAQ